MKLSFCNCIKKEEAKKKRKKNCEQFCVCLKKKKMGNFDDRKQ